MLRVQRDTPSVSIWQSRAGSASLLCRLVFWAKVARGRGMGLTLTKPGSYMNNHHFLALGACALSLLLAPSAAHAADPPPPPKHPEGHQPEGKHGKPGELGEPGKGPKGEHGRPGADDGKPGEGPKPGGRPGEGFRGGLRQLHEEMKGGKLTKDELKARLDKLRESAGQRGKEHRQELSKRWGSTLALPPAREELKLHARRMAFLDRALVLAEAETKNKDKLTARISKLIDQENERHERAMERLKSAPPAPSGASAPSAAPAAAPPPAASAEGAAR